MQPGTWCSKMATAESSATEEKEEDFLHTCTLCMELFRGRTPKILPCFHTFCLLCLTALEASVRSAQREAATDGDTGLIEEQKEQSTQAKGDDEEGEAQLPQLSEGTSSVSGTPTGSKDDRVTQASFPCPTCRTPVPIPEGGVRYLQNNFYVDHEPSPEENLPNTLCDMCEEDNRQYATHACQECRLNMCRMCRRCHDMVGRDHHVTPVNRGRPAKEKREKKSQCLVHHEQALCFYCRRCDVSICLHCKLTSHDGHDTVDLTSAALQAREEITSLIPTAQQQIQLMDLSIQQVDRDDRALTRDVQEVTQKIDARHDALVTWAGQSRERLAEDVRDKAARARSQLQWEKSLGTLTRDTLSTLLARTAGTTAADPHVLTCRTELKAALLSQDQVLRHQQRADHQDRPSSFSSWGGTYDVSEASLVLQEDDVRAYMGRVVEEGAEVGRTPCVSLSELAGRVKRLTQETTENTNILASQINSCSDDVTRLQQKGDEVDKKTDELEKKGNELEKKGNELQKKGNELQKKGNELQKKGNELQKKGDQLEKKLQDEITTSRKAEADLQKTTQSLTEKFGKARVPLFEARGLDKDKTKPWKPMIFKMVVINEGGHYSDSTGIFTAPQAGIYRFTGTAQNGKKDVTAWGYITVDTVDYCRILGSDQGASKSVLVPLDAGQEVAFRISSGVETFHSDVSRSSFSGVLVMALS